MIQYIRVLELDTNVHHKRCTAEKRIRRETRRGAILDINVESNRKGKKIKIKCPTNNMSPSKNRIKRLSSDTLLQARQSVIKEETPPVIDFCFG